MRWLGSWNGIGTSFDIRIQYYPGQRLLYLRSRTHPPLTSAHLHSQIPTQASLSLHDGDFARAKSVLSSNCFPTYASERAALIQLWWLAHLEQVIAVVTAVDNDSVLLRRPRVSTWCQPQHVHTRPCSRLQAEADKGAKLTVMETVRLRRALGCDGDDTSASINSKCIRGPPNLGYAF